MTATVQEIKRYPVPGKYGDLYSFPCEFCHTVIYSKEKNKRTPSGFPNHFVCEYCYNWSIRVRDRPLAQVLKGTIERPKSNGKKFSKEWQQFNFDWFIDTLPIFRMN